MLFFGGGWNLRRIKDLDDDTFDTSVLVRQQHNATIRINYSASGYDITLVKSIGLEQSNGKIHRNYNKWVILPG